MQQPYLLHEQTKPAGTEAHSIQYLLNATEQKVRNTKTHFMGPLRTASQRKGQVFTKSGAEGA